VLPIIKQTSVLAANELVTVAITAAGTDYEADDVITLTGGAGSGGTVKVLTVDTGGEILTAEILAPGSGYEEEDALTQASTTGDGTGATFEVSGLVSYSEIIEFERFNGGISITYIDAAAAYDCTAYAVNEAGEKLAPVHSGTIANSMTVIESPLDRIKIQNTGAGPCAVIVGY
jgi:hypothetical protein